MSDNSARVKAWRTANPAKRAELRKRYFDKKKADPNYWRAINVRAKYGISLEEVAAKWAHQDGKCAICGVEIRLGAGKATDAACIDHNHRTDQVRGLLCQGCNRHLGILEKQEWLQKAIQYLRLYGG